MQGSRHAAHRLLNIAKVEQIPDDDIGAQTLQRLCSFIAATDERAHRITSLQKRTHCLPAGSSRGCGDKDQGSCGHVTLRLDDVCHLIA